MGLPSLTNSSAAASNLKTQLEQSFGEVSFGDVTYESNKSVWWILAIAVAIGAWWYFYGRKLK